MSVNPGACLVVAVSSGKVGYVYISGDELRDWGLSIKASGSIDTMYAQIARWLRYYEPRLIIVERYTPTTRKGRHTRALIETAIAAAEEVNVEHVEALRVQRFRNKYAEAAAIARKFPELEPWLPRPRRIWETEPRNIIYFEAMTLWLAERGIRLDEDRGGSGSEPRPGRGQDVPPEVAG